MKYLGTVVLVFFLIGCQRSTPDRPELRNQLDSVSYSIGLDIGNTLKGQSIEVDAEVLTVGIRDVLSGSETLLTDEQARATLLAFQRQMMTKHEESMLALAEKNKMEGEAFLADNKKKEGVVTLPSGLQYKVQRMGTGKKPKITDNVTLNYRGKLIDGTEFDSSFGHGGPSTFGVGDVIKGFTEGLMLMPVGSKWELYVPADLAYGEGGAGQMIPPNSALIFEVELLSIK